MSTQFQKYKRLSFIIFLVVFIATLTLQLMGNLSTVKGWCSLLYSLSKPFIYGFVIAYILDAPVRLFEKHGKLKRNHAILLTYLIFTAILFVGCRYGIPSLVDNIKYFIQQVPTYTREIGEFVNDLLRNPVVQSINNLVDFETNITSYLTEYESITLNVLSSSVDSLLNLSMLILNLVMGIIISAYTLIDRDLLLLECKRILFLLLKRPKGEEVIEFFKIYHNYIGTYIGIKAIDSTIIACMAFVLLTLAGSEYTVILTVVVGITNMIPYFGPFIGEIVGFLLNVFISPMKALLVLFILFCLQQFDGWYLDPKLIGDRVGVRAIWIIYAVVIGGGFFGVIGMLLASPTAATIKVYYHRLLQNRSSLFTADELPE